MNSFKTIFSRITTLESSVKAIEGIGISVHEVVDGIKQVRPVADIIDDLGKRWSTLNESQQQNIGLQIAGRLTFKKAS